MSATATRPRYPLPRVASPPLPPARPPIPFPRPQTETASPPDADPDFTNSIGMEFKLIPAGEFLMGSLESPEELVAAYEKYDSPVKSSVFESEHPRHAVRIPSASTRIFARLCYGQQRRM